MFEDSLLASGTQRYPRKWTALVSVVVQTFFVGTVIVVPMLFPDAIPFRALRKIVEIPDTPRPAQIEPATGIQRQHRTEVVPERIHVPPSIPTRIAHFSDFPPTGRTGNSGPPDPNGIAGANTGDRYLSELFPSRTSVVPTIQRTQPKRWRVSGGIEQGLLIRNVKPAYPRIAQAAGVQGEVVLQAVIGKDGHIENLHVISGNPLLVKAAVAAVEQWLYRPYFLNGEPVEVETQITVRFTAS